MDRLEAMAILLRVADRGSFSAASRELGVPLPTVSRKVNELERHLGTRLLVRSTRKVALTDAGETYAASARRILEEVDETERVAAGEFQVPRGELIRLQVSRAEPVGRYLGWKPLMPVTIWSATKGLDA